MNRKHYKPCDLPDPNEFTITRDAGNPKEVTNTSVGGPHIELTVDGPDDANRLLIFTGIAILDLEARNDGGIHRGTCLIRLDYPLPKASTFIKSASNASLSAIRNDDTDAWLFAVDCVSTQPMQVEGNRTELVLTAVLGISSDDGDTNLIRMAYQANVLLHVEEAELDSFLVATPQFSGIPPHPVPPDFGPQAFVPSGTEWLQRIGLTGPVPNSLFVHLSSSNPSLVPVQDAPFFLGDPASKDFGPFAVGTSFTRVDVTITASLGSVTKTAVVTVLPPPR
jgi:hypothetical protein